MLPLLLNIYIFFYESSAKFTKKYNQKTVRLLILFRKSKRRYHNQHDAYITEHLFSKNYGIMLHCTENQQKIHSSTHQ